MAGSDADTVQSLKPFSAVAPPDGKLVRFAPDTAGNSADPLSCTIWLADVPTSSVADVPNAVQALSPRKKVVEDAVPVADNIAKSTAPTWMVVAPSLVETTSPE